MDTKTMLIIGGVVLALVIVYVLVKSAIDTKKGVNSEEKQKIEELIRRLLPNAGEFTVAYADWELKSYRPGGRSITTTRQYWYYAIAFQPGCLYVVPLSFAQGDISYSDPIRCTKETLGLVNGKVGENWLELYDKEKRKLASIAVTPTNTKEDKYHPVNIQQKEAAEQFYAFLPGFMEEVNRENGAIPTGKAEKPLQ